MFLPNGRPCGSMVYRGEVLSERSPSSFRAFIAFDPLALASHAITVRGEGCGASASSLRSEYGSLLQVNKLVLDCEGRPTSWRSRRYSSALFGSDSAGRAVFVHTRTPYRMHILGRMLQQMNLGLRGLAYMEGGPEASLVVQDAAVQVREMGSYEDGFFPSDDNQVFWHLPNVIGFVRR